LNFTKVDESKILICAKSRELLWNFGNCKLSFRQFLVNCGNSALGKRKLPVAFVPPGMLFSVRRMYQPPRCYTRPNVPA